MEDGYIDVLIETLWNVNEWSCPLCPPPAPVLIETLWNVNTGEMKTCRQAIEVLIETLWNVNQRIFFLPA